MNKNKSANKNPAKYHLYHALMEALIADEDAMDKKVKDRVKNHKRESMIVMMKTMMMMMKALQLDQTRITDTRDAVVDSSMPRSDTESEHSEQSSDDIPMQDEGHISESNSSPHSLWMVFQGDNLLVGITQDVH
ncbi:hypothetical protein Tco_0166749 [Tanacetum coccineum]